MALQKGRFYNADTRAEVVTCHFNPEQITISKANTWTSQRAAGSDLSEVRFGGSGPQLLSMTLHFDTYERRTDVRVVTDRLLRLMDAPAPSGQSGRAARPPHVEFGWGRFRSFRAAITSFNQKFTMFMPNGTPVRAIVDISLQEVPKASAAGSRRGQNPTSRATGARRARLVHPGDTIDFLAAQELGDPTDWRRLAEANGLDDPRRLRPGSTLLIPAEES